jgi:hypothetical protein
MSPLESIHEQHRQAQKHYHETKQAEQGQRHSRHQQELRDMHGRHQQELKQLHQKHALHHEQVTGQYESMPPDHVTHLSNFLGQQQEQELNGLRGRHGAEEGALHAAHFQEHLRDHVARNTVVR